MSFFEKLIASLAVTLALLTLLSIVRIVRAPSLLVGLAIVLGILIVAYLLYRIWFSGRKEGEGGEIRVRVE